MSLFYLGKCCVCGGSRRVRNIVRLNKRATVAGQGCWGCVLCGLPMAGAVAVLCDECFEHDIQPRFACIGEPGDNARMVIELLTQPFEHDLAKHEAHYWKMREDFGPHGDATTPGFFER